KVRDTIRHYDTVQVIDTIRIVDSIKVYDTVRVTIPPPSPIPPADDGILVGNGSGNLIIDNSTLNGTSSTAIRIRAGTYTSITIENLNGTSDNPIQILNQGRVNIREEMVTSNISNVTISGEGATDL